jgi:hypothetical protein
MPSADTLIAVLVSFAGALGWKTWTALREDAAARACLLRIAETQVSLLRDIDAKLEDIRLQGQAAQAEGPEARVVQSLVRLIDADQRKERIETLHEELWKDRNPQLRDKLRDELDALAAEGNPEAALAIASLYFEALHEPKGEHNPLWSFEEVEARLLHPALAQEPEIQYRLGKLYASRARARDARDHYLSGEELSMNRRGSWSARPASDYEAGMLFLDVLQDRETAKRFLGRAADGGHERAREILQRFGERAFTCCENL